MRRQRSDEVFEFDARRQLVWLNLGSSVIADVFGIYRDDPEGEARERDADCVEWLERYCATSSGRVGLPGRWEVCGRCGGRGVHDPESFSGGFTVEELREDPEFAEEYLQGRYDVSCSECRGRTTVLELDTDRLEELNPVAYHVARTVQQVEAEIARVDAEEAGMRARGIEF